LNKRLLTFVVTGTALALGTLAPSVNAQDIDSQINSANSQIQNLNNQKQAVAGQVEQLSQDLTNVQSRINSVQAEQETAKANLEVLKAEISKLETLIAERNERLKDQARAVQVNGARSYVDFLLNADSITDVVNRIGVIVDLVGANRQLMQEQARDKEQVQTKEQAQKDNLDQQKANEAQLQNLQTELSATFTKHKATLANLSNEELEKSFAIVGTRKPSKDGIDFAMDNPPVLMVINDFIKLSEFSLYGYIYRTVVSDHIRLYAQLKTPRLGKLVMDFKTVFLPIETLYFCKIGTFFLGELPPFKGSFPFPLTKSVQFLFASYVNAFATTLFLLLELACIGILIGVDFLQKCCEKFSLLALSHIFPQYKETHIALLVGFF